MLDGSARTGPHPVISNGAGRFFLPLTNHGAYIDGFAGPQSPKQLRSWTAALVLESEPKWLRKFFLCEISRPGLKALKKLASSQSVARDKKGHKIPRRIKIYPGDFNKSVDHVLKEGGITQKEATFCLLDQRTFECHWTTLKKLADTRNRLTSKSNCFTFLASDGFIALLLASARATKLSCGGGRPIGRICDRCLHFKSWNWCAKDSAVSLATHASQPIP